MSVSGVRAAENNLDGVQRPFSAPDSQQANAEELLAELVRLVESSGLGPGGSPPPAETASKPDRTETAPTPPLETASPPASVDAAPSEPSGAGAVDVEPPPLPEFYGPYSTDPIGRRAGAWILAASALALAGAAAIGAILWLKREDPGLPPGSLKAPPSIAAAQGPAKAQPRSDFSVATSGGAGATAPKDGAQPAQHDAASPEERPIDLGPSAPPLNPAPSAGSAPTATGAAKESASVEKPLPASADAPAAAAPIAASAPMAPQPLDSKPAPIVPPPAEPAQIAAPTPSAIDSGEAARASDAPLPPVRPALKAAREAAGVARRPAPKLDLPTRLSDKSSAQVAVAKAEATAPGAPAGTAGQKLGRGAAAKPEKGLKSPEAAQAPAEAQAARPQPPAPAQQPNPVARAFSNVVGALTSLNPFAGH